MLYLLFVLLRWEVLVVFLDVDAVSWGMDTRSKPYTESNRRGVLQELVDTTDFSTADFGVGFVSYRIAPLSVKSAAVVQPARDH